MADKTSVDPTSAQPESRLDRMARDLSRTLLHGARAQVAGGTVPATVATGQQISVEVPPIDPMTFNFEIGKTTGSVVVSNGDAKHYQELMLAALATEAGRKKYLTLTPEDIPHWVFQQRQLPASNALMIEDRFQTAVPDPSSSGAVRKLDVVLLPTSTLQEASAGASESSSVSLWKFDEQAKKLRPVAPGDWQPAVVVRFPLKKAGAEIFEIQGAPQGIRYYLDQLGLLPGSDVQSPPDVVAISLVLESRNSSGQLDRDGVAEWTVVRTNLTTEARSGNLRLFPASAVPLPYVAISGSGLEQDKDAIRLMQMASIANSGGYYLRAKTESSFVEPVLLLTVLLKSVLDADPDHEHSAMLPRAANAVAFAAPTNIADTVRFNGIEHIHVAPLAPPGVLVFGWNRHEQKENTDDVEKFGYGTVSLVAYSAQDAGGTVYQNAETCLAVSPTEPPEGNPVNRRGSPLPSDPLVGMDVRQTAALQLLAPHHVEADSRRKNAGVDADGAVERHYRSRFQCFLKTESPYARFRDPLRSRMRFDPIFRDVFGNQFAPFTAAPVEPRLFYTDPVFPPGEWPGVQFSVYPGAKNGKACLFLEMSYRLLEPDEDKEARLQRLREVQNQLDGADNDVAIYFDAPPLRTTAFPLPCMEVRKQLLEWMKTEEQNHTQAEHPLVCRPAFLIPVSERVTEVKQFQPKLTVVRENRTFHPLDCELPVGKLGETIKNFVTSANSPVALTKTGILPESAPELRVRTLTPKQERTDEFLAIAEAFHKNLATVAQAQFGFLRNRVNEHELWLVPDELFPRAEKDGAWSFATARPLRNILGTQTFEVPDFDRRCSASSPPCWNGRSVDKTVTVVDQDFDQLGRIAFGLLEKQTTDLEVVTNRGNASAVELLLTCREAIGGILSEFDTTGANGYLVSLLKNPGSLDGDAIRRITKDSFLRDLNAFYAVDTILQLPLRSSGDNQKIRMFEGSVTPPAGSAAPTARFSDVLLAADDTHATVLYDVPPGARPEDMPAMKGFEVTFSHVQLPTVSGPKTAFDQGRWLKLAAPWSVSWEGLKHKVPVALREFPQKPVIQFTETLLPWMDFVTGKIAVPATIDAAQAALLVQWGWRFAFSFEDKQSETVHVTLHYNEPPGNQGQKVSRDITGKWVPRNLLHTLYVLKLLHDRWDKEQNDLERLQMLNDLADALRGHLKGPVKKEAPAAQTRRKDKFALRYGQAPEQTEWDVMRGLIDVMWSKVKNTATATIVAKADVPGNRAVLTCSDPVLNYRPILRLLRNETFLDNQPANPALIYECALVESPLECWAQNLWAPPLCGNLAFAMTSLDLKTALTSFFKAVFHGQELSSEVRLEVGTSLVWKKGALEAITPFSILPTDAGSGARMTVAKIADFIFTNCEALLGPGAPKPAESDTAAVRLRIKITRPEEDLPAGRRLLEIAAIDFALK